MSLAISRVLCVLQCGQSRFGLPAILPETLKRLIKRADRACAWFEATQLAGFSEDEAKRHFPRPRFVGAADIHLSPAPTAHVQAAFLDRFRQLHSAV